MTTTSYILENHVKNDRLTLEHINTFFKDNKITKLEPQREQKNDRESSCYYEINVLNQEDSVTNNFRNTHFNVDHQYNNHLLHSGGYFCIRYVPKGRTLTVSN